MNAELLRGLAGLREAIKDWGDNMRSETMADLLAHVDRIELSVAQGQGCVMVPRVPTEAMIRCLQADAPYICRRRMDKTAYEVIRLDGEDWQEVVSDEQTVMFTGPEDAASFECGRLSDEYRYAAMLAAAPAQPDGVE